MFPVELVQERHSIIFSDCRNRTAKSIVAGMREFSRRGRANAFVILFNVDSSLKIEEELLGLGIWGIFYEEDPPSSLPLGVKAICKGEIWLSRQLMSSCLENFRRRNSSDDQSEKKSSLTRRECEVLKMLSAGSGNIQIATDLCVSIHTVRSHLYRIFKKIDVANRHQAAIWANRNL
jgi:LuxR family transcriptional regulator of csgAB operon